jgi:hypothetical protein
MRRIVRITLATAVVLVSTATGAQQSAASTGGFGLGYTDFGATVGLGGIGGAFAIGGRFERAIKALPELNNGILGFQLSADWYRYDQRFLTADYDFTYLPIGATANYHFGVTNKKFDPFVGLGLGYVIVSSSYDGVGNVDASGAYFAGRLGLRYFVNSSMAAYVDTGVGSSALNVGLTFRASGR